MHMNFKIVTILIVFLSVSCSQMKPKDKSDETESFNWHELIDADLSNWDKYLSYQHQVGYNGSQPLDENGEPIPPIGLNKPGYNVFTTQTIGDETIIRVSGEYYGCLVTKEEYENYHFQLKFKWGEEKWAFRKNLLMDSGILYHSVGDHGAEFWRSWMVSQEFQIMEGHTGDYWCQLTSEIDIRAYKPEGNLNPMAHESQDYLPISMYGQYKNYCLRSSNFEKPHGEWNTLDLYCFEGKSLHVVNGEVVMILKNSRNALKNGETVPLTKGKIQLQSEAAELFFKDIKIREIESLSPEQEVLF